MTQDNSVYTVTYPDLYVAESGPTVLMTSTNPELIDSTLDQYKTLIHNANLVFYIQSKRTNESSVGWMWYVSRSCDTMIVDIDTCSWVDIATALTKVQDVNHKVVFYTEKQKRKDAAKLINATSEYILLTGREQLTKYIDIEFAPIIE